MTSPLAANEVTTVESSATGGADDGGAHGSNEGGDDAEGKGVDGGEGGMWQTDSTLATSHADTATDAACVQAISHNRVGASQSAAGPHTYTSGGSVSPSGTQQPSHEHPSI